MLQSKPILTLTVKTNGDVQPYHAISFEGGAPLSNVLGITATAAENNGDTVAVHVLGTALARIGEGGVACGMPVKAVSTGEIIAAEWGYETCGIALGNGDEGDLVEILLQPRGQQLAFFDPPPSDD
jgi:hypothetical protein